MDLSAITTFLFDLDGVLWRGGAAIEGAAESVNRLREAGRKCIFCTNNSSRTAAYFVDKLKEVGVEAKEDEILTSSWVTAQYLSGHFTGPFLAYVVGEEGIRVALRKIGAHIVPDSDLDGITRVDCVVVGIDRKFDYQKLANAQKLILNGALFVATNRDGSYPTENGVAPGGGSVVAAVETASGTTPVTVGKPRPVMIELALRKLGAKPDEVVMVGDRLDTDIACARRAGITAICVLTGVTSLEKAQRARGELRPHLIIDNLSQLCEDALAKSPAITNIPAVATAATTLEPSAETAQDTSPESDEEPEETLAGTPQEAAIIVGQATQEAAESTFNLPSTTLSEDEKNADAAPVQEPVAADQKPEEDTSWTDDIDQLFKDEEEKEVAPPPESAENNAAAEDNEDNIDFDSALSVVEEGEPEPPSNQKPPEETNAEADSFEWKLD